MIFSKPHLIYYCYLDIMARNIFYIHYNFAKRTKFRRSPTGSLIHQCLFITLCVNTDTKERHYCYSNKCLVEIDSSPPVAQISWQKDHCSENYCSNIFNDISVFPLGLLNWVGLFTEKGISLVIYICMNKDVYIL